jgi:hypothetical protein
MNIVTEVLRGFLQSFRSNSGVVSRLDCDRFLPDPSQFITRYTIRLIVRAPERKHEIITTRASFLNGEASNCRVTTFAGIRSSPPPEALCYKPEGRGFDTRWGHWIFQLTWCFQPRCGPGVDSASNRNEYQESSWGWRAADNLTAICGPIL